LRKHAEIYDKCPELGQGYGQWLPVFDKPSLVAALKAVGGKFTKRVTGSENYSQMLFTSVADPTLVISIARDKVCEKVITFKCLPVLGDDEVKELDADFLEAA